MAGGAVMVEVPAQVLLYGTGKQYAAYKCSAL